MKLRVIDPKFQPYFIRVGDRLIKFTETPVELTDEEGLDILSQNSHLLIAIDEPVKETPTYEKVVVKEEVVPEITEEIVTEVIEEVAPEIVEEIVPETKVEEEVITE